VAKIKKISLDFDDDPITLQLISIKKSISHHKFFFEINKRNKFKFERAKNLVIYDNSIEYEFLYMKSYDIEGNNICSVIANKSFENCNNTSIDAFSEHNSNEFYLLNKQKNIDFIMKIHDSSLEFSVHLLPNEMLSFVKENHVKPKDLIYQYIQENE